MRKFSLFIIILFLLPFMLFAGEHPSIFITSQEAAEIRASLDKYPLLKKSFENLKTQTEKALRQGIEVPPPGEAGGYEHEKHKQNYRDMQAAGVLYTITGNEKYAQFVKDMLFAYAEMYPKLGPHPLSHKQRPGKLFHQTLNETVWLVYTSIAYDCISDWLSADDRKHIETNVFDHIIELFTVEHSDVFNRIHNHGTWMVASVGMYGYVIGDKNLVEMALYGTKKDGKGGFLKQLDLLFSPDGYYLEGPYYIRYALRPFFLYAEAVERNEPQRKIFEYRDGILGKVHYSTMQTVFSNGTFPPINDASRSMDVRSIGPVVSNDIAYQRYGANKNLLAIAAIQDQVILNKAGLMVAKDMATADVIPELAWKSVEFTDGHDGKQGGLGILRSGTGEKQTMALMKYGTHGLGHGHFDKLHFSLFDQGSQVVFDYGFSRWINMEPKFGGRYLPENDSYAKQTIAHNTVTVDQKSQNFGNRKEADKVAAERHFFHAGGDVQVMSARSTKHYPGVQMQRTLFLVDQEKLTQPIVVDLFRVESTDEHSYDYPIHFHGQLITTILNIRPP
ncbi:MAG: chondroitin lyase [Calditrichaeota bacterium]|nr:MAG: chondroitin lyase [Calditrichota bacterium]